VNEVGKKLVMVKKMFGKFDFEKYSNKFSNQLKNQLN